MKKYSFHIILILSIVLLCVTGNMQLFASTDSNCYTKGEVTAMPLYSSSFAEGVKMSFSYAPLFSLSAEAGSLLHEMMVTASVPHYKAVALMPSALTNVTGSEEMPMTALRLLPSGEHFSEPAELALAYDPTLLPQATTANDIYTFFYDSLDGRWVRLERVRVDTVRHLVVSLTTHFTDFANAVISVPELPQTSAFVPTAMTDIPDPDPLEGIPMVTVDGMSSFGSPMGDNSGSASLTYPIVIPPGRHGLQPDVSLHYNSDNGNGILGVGWSISMPAVTIDTRWGVPRYSPIEETEAYLVGGEQVVMTDGQGNAMPLPHQDTVFRMRDFQTKRFRFRDMRNASRVIRHGQTPQTYWWEVNTTSGVTYYYGRLFDPTHPNDDSIDENSVLRTADGDIGYWALTAMVDLYGNYVKYYNNNTAVNGGQLQPHPDGDNIYLTRIEYTGNYNTGLAPSYTIDFTRFYRSDAFSDARLGMLRKTDMLLCHIGVLYGDSAITRYYMSYDCGENSLYKSRLVGVEKVDMPTDMYGHDCNYLEQHVGNTQYYAGSRTVFSYNNAPSSVFDAAQTLNNSGRELNKSVSGGWNIGGTATVGTGPLIEDTGLSGGGHYNFGMNYGQMRSMLLDLNGDGLPDKVYKDGQTVKYCRQRSNCSGFEDAVTVQGLSRLSHDVSRTHTWGLQLSFFASLNYSNPITMSYTDCFFTDINADGLPDMVTSEGVLFNHLTSDGHPSFSLYTGGSITVPQNNSSCENTGIYYSGSIDERLECDLTEVAVDSIPLESLPADAGLYEPAFISEEIPESGYIYEPRTWHPLSSGNSKGAESAVDGAQAMNDTPDNDSISTDSKTAERRALPEKSGQTIPEGFYEHGYTYRIRNGWIVKFALEEECEYNDLDPKIETVRVWVAPQNYDDGGFTSIFHLVPDNSVSRQQSRKADGVKLIVQKNSSNQTNGTKFTATQPAIISIDTLEADDYGTYIKDIRVGSMMQGDMLLFRLCSGEDNRFDVVDWDVEISQTSNGQTSVFSSENDYVCTGKRYFSAPVDGEAIVRYKWENGTTTPLQLSFSGSAKPAVALTSSASSNNVYAVFDTLQLNQGDSIVPHIIYSGTEPQWSDIHIFPEIEFRGHYYNSDSTLLLPDTSFFYTDVSYPCSTIDIDSVYAYLFGPLHKGWGRFAYNNRTGSDTLDVCSLVNTERQAMHQAEQNGSTWETMEMPDDSDINTLLPTDVTQGFFEAYHLYNPLSDSSNWVPVYADSRTERWIPYGNIGYISRTRQSNSRNMDISPQQEHAAQVLSDVGEETETDIPYYDSAIPVAENNVGGKNKYIRKSTKSVQHSISGGALFMNMSHSWGTYCIETDFIDLNGDGFPDAVGPSAVQYTTPWGGLGDIIDAGIDAHESSNEGSGFNFSGTAALMKKLTGNSVTKSGFTMQGSGGGVSHNDGVDRTERTFIDMNGDGLPDIVTLVSNTHAMVRYNLGYSFTDTLPLQVSSFFISSGESHSTGLNGAADASWLFEASQAAQIAGNKPPFSVEQYSISGGLDASRSVNISNCQLTDINGDGLPDLVRTTLNGQLQAAYNKGLTFDNVFRNVQLQAMPQKSHTYNLGAALSGTFGFTIMGIVKFCFGLQGGGSLSLTYTDTTFIDMNGDGYPDCVMRAGNNGDIHVRYNKLNGTNLLTDVTNATGQTLHFEYALSAPADKHRQRKWEIVTIEDKDNNNPWNYRQTVKTYKTYKSPFYDNHERTDYGYHNVSTFEENIRFTEEEFRTDALMMRGYKLSDVIKDIEKHPYIGHRYQYIFEDEFGHDISPSCEENDISNSYDVTRTDYYEGEPSPQITSAVRIKYNALHNMVEYIDEGDINIAGDEWTRHVSYLPTGYKNLVSLPVSDSVMTTGGGIIRLRQATWTQTGRLKHVLVSDPATGTNAITSMQYDSYGNIDRYALPPNAAGERVNYRIWYDAASMSRPVYIRNQFGEGQQYQYEPYWGKVIMSIDPAGEEIHYIYDRMGRLTTVVAPREHLAASGGWLPAGSNVPYTIRYTYNNIRHNLADLHDTITHTYVLKEMASAPGHDVIRESAIYSARGEMLQHKKITEVNGSTEIVTDGVHVQDALGRVIATLYPSISNSPLWVYDGTSNSTGANPTKVWYDVLDRDTLINLPDFSFIHKRRHFAIDLNGALRLASWQTDQLGNVARQLTSPQGWTIQTTQADNTHTMFDYNCIGELQRVIDADGYRTYYEYDLFGRRTRRIHPDANVTEWTYDPAGNIIFSATQRQKDATQKTEYYYCFNRLMSTIPNGHPWDSVLYNYDTAGRLAWREDKTGSERLWYDQLGNVRQTLRRIYTPAEDCAYQFKTQFEYDSFGRIRTLFYPDGERVNYTYNIGGDLIDVNGNEHYLQKIMYNVLGNMTYKMYGNGYLTAHSYDTQRGWLQTTYTNGTYNLQDIEYQHDYVGNITKIKQNAIAAAGMGGDYTQDYAYNNRYRLVRNDFTSTPFGNYRYDVSYSPTGRMGSKTCNSFPFLGPVSLTYGYDDHTLTHQIRVLSEYYLNERLQLYWDRDGNLEQIQPAKSAPRYHLWDDEDRLLASIGGTTCGFYGNAADGRRAYKLTGICGQHQWNNGTIIADLTFDDMVIYPNPYITVTPHGYTKHYFAGTERIATAIGGGGFCNMIAPTDNLTNTEQVRKHEILKYLSSYLSDQTEDHTNNEDIAHHLLPELQYSDARQTLHDISYNIYLRTSLCTTLNELCNKQWDDDVFYYHPDHLGGAAWITDMSGKPLQYLHYAPYGELVANQMPYGIDERFKFTGKERDAETGYDNFEARPYLSAFSIFGKVDPLSDKNIHENPYFYCSGNPIGYIDPNGMDWYENENGEIIWTDYHSQQELNQNNINGKYLGEAVLYFNGFKDEHFGTKNGKGKYLGGEDSKLADVTLYGPQGNDDITRGLIGFTMTSNYSIYGAIDDGIWPANYDYIGKSGQIKSHWTLNYRGYIPTYDYQPNMSPFAGNLKGTMYKDGIFIHSTLKSNNRVGATTSTGCLLLDWNSMRIFNSKMNGVSNFSVIVRRR